MRKSFIFLLLIVLLSCSNKETRIPLNDSIFISPKTLELTNYSGELISFYVTNFSDSSVSIVPDIIISTKYNDKDYIIQKKSEIYVKPNISFSFATTPSGSENTSSLALVIESYKEFLVYNPKDFVINPQSSKKIGLSIKTDNLYFQVENKNIFVTNEKLYGYINFYHNDYLINSVPVTINFNK